MTRENKDSFLDKAGQTVKVGDCILYASSLGRCAALSFGRILKIEQVEEYSNLKWRIGFIGVDDYGPKLTLKKGTLQFSSRMILANGFIPEAHKQLLES